MKSIVVVVLTLSVIFSGCSSIENQLSAEQAKSIVVEHHTKNIGEVEIISITTKSNHYIIEWQNKENCENGTDRVNEEGVVIMIEATIC